MEAMGEDANRLKQQSAPTTGVERMSDEEFEQFLNDSAARAAAALDDLRDAQVSKFALFKEYWTSYRSVPPERLRVYLETVREELGRIENELARINDLREQAREGPDSGDLVIKEERFETVEEAWSAPFKHETIEEAAEKKLEELSDEHARQLALEMLLLYHRKHPGATKAPEYDRLPDDLTKTEQREDLDFSRPDNRQKFTDEVQVESVRRFNRYIFVEGLTSKSAIKKVQDWQRKKAPDGRAASESQIYAWRNLHQLTSPDDISPEIPE